MVKRKFICKNCGYKFEIEVFEEGEAEEKRVSTQPVRCPRCGGKVERI
jgi:DNA-directed RNA polymerase subunit RPC12/RpoP